MKENPDGTVTVQYSLDIVALWPDHTTTTFHPKSLEEHRLINSVLEAAFAHQGPPAMPVWVEWDTPQRGWWWKLFTPRPRLQTSAKTIPEEVCHGR